MIENQGISQSKLIRMTGIDTKNVQKVFRNPTAIVTTDTLDRFALALGVDVSELVETIHNEQG